MLQGQITDGIHDLHELRVALSDRVPKLRGVDVHVVEEAAQVRLGTAAPRRILDETEGIGEGLVQVLITSSPRTHIPEQVRGTNKNTLLLDDALTRRLRLRVAQGGVIKGCGLLGRSSLGEDRLALGGVHVLRQVFRDETVEQETQHVALEVPTVHTAPQVVSDAPDRLMQLGSFAHCRHGVLISGSTQMCCVPTRSLSSPVAHPHPEAQTA